MPNGPPVDMQLGWGSDFTALEALAEVSRQVDMNEKRDDRSINNRSVGHGSRASEPPRADRLEIQEQYTVDNPPVSYEQRVQKDKKGSPLVACVIVLLTVLALHPKAPRRQSEASLLQSPPPGYQRMVPSRDTSPNLTSMAAAAARFVPSMVDPQSSMVDPQLLGEDVIRAHQDNMTAKAIEQELKYEPVTNLDEPFFQTPAEAASSSPWPMMESAGAQMYPAEPVHPTHGYESSPPVQATPNPTSLPQRPLAVMPMTTEFSAEYGNGQKGNKPKVRGHFKPDRRLQVQQVRKIGACLRCRMLKKPCTQGTPCETCTNVDRARLWQDQCIRAKLPEVLQMYNAGLHYTLSYHETNLTKSQTAFVASTHLIDVSHFPDQNVYATFECLEGQDHLVGDLGSELKANSRRLLKTDDQSQKLAEYAKTILPSFIAKEASHFMKVTLDFANAMLHEHQNDALGQAIELWVIVQTLVDSNTAWVISERDEHQAPGSGTIIDKSVGDHTYDDICGQLNASAEKKAGHLCKDVLADFEKQMINRNNKKSAFDYFLIAIIVLNCVEKSMWLFKSWENDDFKSRWPLDKAPDFFVSQGEQLAQILNTLLRTRSSPPKTFNTAEGLLAAEGDEPSLSYQYFNALQISSKISAIVRHFKTTDGLIGHEVMDKAANYTFEPGNCRCFDFRLTARLILPLQPST